MLIYDVILDVGMTGCQQSVSLYQGDDRFKLFRITLLQNGRSCAVAPDLNVRLHALKPDDSVLSAKCGVRGGSIYYLPAANATDMQGTIRCQLQIRDHGGAILFSPEFSMEIAATVPAPELPDGATEDAEYDAEVLSELTASADGSTLLFRGRPVGAVPSVASLPQTAAEDAIVYRIGSGLYRFADDAWTRLTNDDLADAVAILQADSHTHANKSALDTVTAAKVANWDGAAGDSHTHANKSALDTVTAAKVANWDGAAGDSHTHANKSALDTVTAAKVTDWDSAATDKHTHANKSALDTVTAAKVADWDSAAGDSHTHANKSALDTVTAAKVANWDSAAGDSHTHANKSALDTVTAAKVADWDGAATDKHTHANKSALDTVTAAKVADWDGAATDKHTHANKSALDTVTAAKVAEWDSAAGDSHTHANKSALDTVTSAVVSNSHTHENKSTLDRIDGLKFAQWDALRADVAVLQMDSHGHTNKATLNTITAAKTASWDAAAQDKHQHANAESLDKIQVVSSYASLNPSGTNGSVGIVTGFDNATKPLLQYNAQTDANAQLTLAGEMTYDASAQTNTAALVVRASSDDIGVTLLPVYTQAQAQNDPSFGELGMILVTEDNDPMRYMVVVGCESILQSDLFDDLCVSVSDEAQIEVFLLYAFEDVEGVITVADGPVADTLAFTQGWNVLYVIADGEEEIVDAAYLADPNAYCCFGRVGQMQSAPSQPDILYEALCLGVRADKRGVYVRTGGQWDLVFDAQVQALNDRVSALESSAQT